MAQDVSYPIPIGVTTSFSNVAVGVNTPTFTITPDGNRTGADDIFTITYNPIDSNNPGTVTLVDGNGNTQATLTTGGYQLLQTRGGSGWYFTNTTGAAQLAVTKPTIWR